MSIGIDTSSYSSTLIGNAVSGQNNTSSGLRTLAKLDLTDDERQQIRSIFQNARTNNLSSSDVQSQIQAVLTPAQQQQYSALQSSQNSNLAASQSTISGTANTAGPFSALQLTSDQQQQISQILENSQSESPQQVKSQIDSILTTTQKQQLAEGLQGQPGDSNVQNQIAAANVLNQQQVKTELSASGSSGIAVAGHAHHHHGGGGHSADSSDGIDSSLTTGTSGSALDALLSSTATSGTTNSSLTASGLSNTALANDLSTDLSDFLTSLNSTFTSENQNLASLFTSLNSANTT